MKVIILAGGKGRRLYPYTVVLPKPLMPVGDFPILEVVLRQLKGRGLTDITLAVGHLGNLIQAFFGDGSKWGVKINYSFEEEPLGTVGPLTCLTGLKETFMVMNGDLLTTLNYLDLIEYHKGKKAIATVAAQERWVDIDFGVIQRDKDDRMAKYIEKPRLSYLVSMGIYVFEPELLEVIPKAERFDFPDLMQRLLQDDKRVAIYRSDEFWLDIGRPDDYQRAVEEFEKNPKMFLSEEQKPDRGTM
ncbi:MAG: NTP transferase domain-containing protein [Candidatus Zixiibacteriota bacterium]|nr:MAG: NTP transferase domain-containing protein [candidate division Zixibacteria bacterium]